MTGARFLPNQSYVSLKAATRELVRLVDGPVRAATISRLGQSEYSRGGSLGDRDIERFLPIDVIADLEAEAGKPVITERLAELADCLLIPMPKAEPGDLLSLEAGASAQRFGQMMSDFGSAMQDGSINSREAGLLKADIDLLLTQLARFRATLETRTAEETDG